MNPTMLSPAIKSISPKTWEVSRVLWILLTVVMLHTGNAAAQSVGVVINLDGMLVAKKTDGVVKTLMVNSSIDQGDLLESQKDTYARIKFIDNSEVTLRPETQFRIDNYSFEEAKLDNDRSVFSLIKGGLRTLSGSLGKRNKARYQLNTPAATIGIRGTTFIAQYVQPDTDGSCVAADSQQDGEPNNCHALKPGLYMEVINGAISANNEAGSQIYIEGQFGYAADDQQTPIILSTDPGITFDLGGKKLGGLECRTN